MIGGLLAIKIDDLPLSPGKTLSSSYPTISSLINIVLKNSLTVIGLILVILLISGGLMYIIGAGNDDPKSVQKGQQIIVDAALGLAVVFLSYLIVQIVELITGLSILRPGI